MLDPVFFHLPKQRRAVDLHELGGFDDLPVDRLQDLENVFTLGSIGQCFQALLCQGAI